jgi:hypothetical protein
MLCNRPRQFQRRFVPLIHFPIADYQVSPHRDGPFSVRAAPKHRCEMNQQCTPSRSMSQASCRTPQIGNAVAARANLFE